MSYRRGDVILVRYPHSDLVTYSKRPALIIQSDKIHTGIPQQIAVLITSKLNRTGPTRIMFQKNSPEGKKMKLLSDSVVVTDNIATINQREIDKVIGSCPAMHEVDKALKQTLDL